MIKRVLGIRISLFFFVFLIFLFIDFFFFFFLAALGLCCCVWVFLSCDKQKPHFIVIDVQVSHCGGFPCRVQALQLGFRSCTTWAQYFWCMGSVSPKFVDSSQTRYQTCVLCTERQIPIHCTTSEVLHFLFLFLQVCPPITNTIYNMKIVYLTSETARKQNLRKNESAANIRPSSKAEG